jgi:hypothetical protein
MCILKEHCRVSLTPPVGAKTYIPGHNKKIEIKILTQLMAQLRTLIFGHFKNSTGW